MRKQLLLTLLLTGGMFFVGTPTWASPKPSPKPAEEQTSSLVTGKVLDENGDPAIGASVVVKSDNKIGTAVDMDGNFSINVVPGTKLTVSYVGYQSVDVNAQAGMVVRLDRNDAYLDEVVVVGYGTQKKVNLTGAVSTVDVEKQLASRPQQDLAKALQGAVPGLTITTNNGGINSGTTLRIRGTGTLSNSATSDPLIIVDGVPVSAIAHLNPDNIAEVTVLKDAASSSIYGTRAAFGVILITTKSGSNQQKDHFTLKYSNNFSWSQATKLPEWASVPEQLEESMAYSHRTGGAIGLFDMILTDDFVGWAQAWYDQNGGKKAGYREMRQYVSPDDVGDYYVNSDGYYWFYADWDMNGIYFNNAAPSNTHNVSLDGSSGRASYYANFGYNKRQGLFNFGDDNIERYTADANFQVDVTDWLTTGVRINYSHRTYNYINPDRNPFQYMRRWGSYFDPLGYMLDEYGNPVDCRNDMAYYKQAGSDVTTYDILRAQAWIRAKITKDITLNVDFAYLTSQTGDKYNRQPITVWDTWTTSNMRITEINSTTHACQWHSTDNTWTTNFYATYDKTFNKDHNLKVMLGFNAEQEKYNYFYARRYDLLDTTLPEISLATGDQMDVDSDATHRATAGFFGRINYDYKGIYLFEVNGRFDGSSRFPAADQWAFFPSVSAGYRFSEEKYWDNLRDVVSNAKLRFSYGQIGNEAVGSNRFISTITEITSYWMGSSDTIKMSMFGMPSTVSESLTWERVETLDLGLDLGFFNNSLNLTADIYQRETKGMLAPQQTLPNAIGTSAPYQNAGDLRTRGYEIGLTWNHRFGDWNVYASASFADCRTIIKDWYNESKLVTDYWSGRGYGDIYGFVTDRYFTLDDFKWHYEDGGIVIDGYADGVASQLKMETGNFQFGPGDIKFKDLNGDNVIDSGSATADDMGDLTVIGNEQPRYEYSFRVGATWKGFDIDLYFQGVGKREIWTNSSFVLPMAQGEVSYYGGETYNKIIYAEDNHTVLGYEINQKNQYPCMYAGGFASGSMSGVAYGCYNFYEQSRYLQDLSYLRLKNLTFGYTIPANITRKFYVQNLRVYFSGENLFFLHDGSKQYPLDPEIHQGSQSSYMGEATWGRAYPMMRTYSFGFQLTF